MKLHILYNGMAEGGAQKFASNLAKNGFVTSTIRTGNFRDVLEGLGLPFLETHETVNRDLDLLVLSDVRALQFFVRNSKCLKARHIYFVPHTDKILKVGAFVRLICDFYKITILPTTRCQKIYFREESWFTVGEIPNFVEKNTSDSGIIYFGRFEKVKRLQQLIDDFNCSATPRNGTLTLQGTGTVLLKRCGSNVRVNRSWLPAEGLNEIIKKNRFNIVYSKTEGLSLSSLEAIGKGLIPLFYSKNCCINYGLTDEHLVQSAREFSQLQGANFISNERILDSLKKDAESFRFLYE